MTDLLNKVCIVTGAAKSLGYFISERLAKSGAKVILIDIDPIVISSASQLRSIGMNAEGVVLDITNEEEVSKQFKKIIDHQEQIYALVNVAGAVTQNPIEKVTQKDWERMMAINVYGSFYCIKAVIPSMKKNKKGKIINFSSKSGKTGSALMVPYSTAKGAIITMTQAMALEVADYNININALCPGIVENTGVWDAVSEGYINNLKLSKEDVVEKFTKKIPLGRLAEIEDIVSFCEFLVVSGEYCTGQAFNISGGREVH